MCHTLHSEKKEKEEKGSSPLFSEGVVEKGVSAGAHRSGAHVASRSQTHWLSLSCQVWFKEQVFLQSFPQRKQSHFGKSHCLCRSRERPFTFFATKLNSPAMVKLNVLTISRSSFVHSVQYLEFWIAGHMESGGCHPLPGNPSGRK